MREEIDQSLSSEDVSLVEAIVGPDSTARGKTARGLHLHAAYGVNLLGVSRRGTRFARRLGRIAFHPGDVLLLQGRTELVQAALPRLGLLPLTEREFRVGQRRRLFFPVAVFVGAVFLASFEIVPVQIAFVAAAAVRLVTRVLTLQAAYQAIDWPVIILFGAMIPVGEALETTGGAALGIVLVTTMLSAVVNNATAVILMKAPIGIGVAATLGAASDPFFIAVAIGASSAFLTPIGHQSNTIVMGPAGYQFGDYFRLGLPLVVVIVAFSIPLIMWVWPMGI